VEIKIGGKTRFENLLKQLFHSPLWDTRSTDALSTHDPRFLITLWEDRGENFRVTQVPEQRLRGPHNYSFLQ